MFEQLLARLAKAFAAAKIPYMIIGGQAVLLYGEPRLTKDIDITLGVDQEALSRIQNVCADLGLEALVDDVPEFVARTKVLPVADRATGLRVDLIFSNTEYEATAISRARQVEVGGLPVNYAAPEDLIIHKIIAGRPVDLEDARKIIVKNPDLDREYIAKWLQRFDEALAGDFFETYKGLKSG